MLDGLFFLLVLSVVMALASFFAGALPLSMKLTQSQLRLVSTIGMGVLVGTSLIVIIPEGIEAIYSAGSTHTHSRRGIAGLVSGNELRVAGSVQSQVDQPKWILSSRQSEDLSAFNSLPGPIISASVPAVEPAVATMSETTTSPSSKETESEHSDPPTFWIGLSLISGFILMYLIDKLPHHASGTLSPPAPPRHISLNNLSLGLSTPSSRSDPEESRSFLQSLSPSPNAARSLATTTGLVIHAAADGIALGASTSTSNSNLGFVIFLAIMIHKAPAAFGLTSVLLKQGVSKRGARGHLVIFSLAAPVGALGTFFLVHLLGGGGISDGEGEWWTGMLLLFSGGTFLYVAMHAMEEDKASAHDHSGMNGYNEGGDTGQVEREKAKGGGMRDTFAAVAGMLLPLLTQFGHHH